jgi:hypothetical protein
MFCYKCRTTKPESQFINTQAIYCFDCANDFFEGIKTEPKVIEPLPQPKQLPMIRVTMNKKNEVPTMVILKKGSYKYFKLSDEVEYFYYGPLKPATPIALDGNNVVRRW